MFIVTGLTAALPCLAACIYADSIYYGRFTFTPWNFFKFNVLSGGSDTFGVDPWHFYLTKYCQIYLKCLSPFFYYGFYKFNMKMY